MSAWDAYPDPYRQEEIERICAAVSAGECVSLAGLSGAGKSNLLGFLARRVHGPALPLFELLDCNRLTEPEAGAFFAFLSETLGGPANATLRLVEDRIAARLEDSPTLCLLIDRFDALPIPAVAGGLRALRDRFKYDLTYVVATRRPLDPSSELTELFFAHTLWLGPLRPPDALWSARRYAARRGLSWDEATLASLVNLSWGYPALLRAACEAHAAGCTLDLNALRAHPAVQRRVAEFWADHPSPEELRECGLSGQPLLARAPSPAQLDPAELTAAEQRLLEFFQSRAGQLCAKDELIRAVWPEESVAQGLRDDSLSQLVHRLREKIGARFIQTIPSRGYRFNP